MPDYLIVLLKIAAMFAVMAVGWLARRFAYLNAALTSLLSRLVVDVVFPCLVFTQMLRTVDSASLRESWLVPVFGVGVILLAVAVGWLLLPRLASRNRLPTLFFLAALPNWIFLPLPIVEELFGDAGVRDVLLFNIGAQLALWSLGVWTLQGAAPNLKAFRNLLKNPGLLATVLGITAALLFPSARGLESTAGLSSAPTHLAAAAIVQAMVMLGGLTIPLSLLVTGAQLGAIRTAGSAGRNGELAAVIVVRLILAPIATVAAFRLLLRAGLVVPESTRFVCYLISAMPVAISASMMTERYGGDNDVSARAIFWSTIFSMATVPVFYRLVHYFGL